MMQRAKEAGSVLASLEARQALAVIPEQSSGGSIQKDFWIKGMDHGWGQGRKDGPLADARYQYMIGNTKGNSRFAIFCTNFAVKMCISPRMMRKQILKMTIRHGRINYTLIVSCTG